MITEITYIGLSEFLHKIPNILDSNQILNCRKINMECIHFTLSQVGDNSALFLHIAMHYYRLAGPP